MCAWHVLNRSLKISIRIRDLAHPKEHALFPSVLVPEAGPKSSIGGALASKDVGVRYPGDIVPYPLSTPIVIDQSLPTYDTYHWFFN